MSSTIEVVDFRPDCSKCHALCCVGLAFDWPHYKKPAGEPCKNLDADFRCSKWATLEEEGFTNCRRFSCHGAGQAVTQFARDNDIPNWRESPIEPQKELVIFQQVCSKLYNELTLVQPPVKDEDS